MVWLLEWPYCIYWREEKREFLTESGLLLSSILNRHLMSFPVAYLALKRLRVIIDFHLLMRV